MCVIIISPVGTNVSQDILQAAIERNPHGWGLTLAKHETGEMHVVYGAGIADAWKAMQKGRNYERVFHARVSTSGKVNHENQHPFLATDPEGNERYFFHNGVIRDIPELDEDYCDSWHMSKIVAAIPTSNKLLTKLEKNADKNNSRYVLACKTQTWYFGRGWLTRDGVAYSNASALGGTLTGGSKAAAKGGKFDDKEIEVTCPDYIAEFGYDATRKLYSSLIPAPKPAATTYSTYTHGGGYHQQDFTKPVPPLTGPVSNITVKTDGKIDVKTEAKNNTKPAKGLVIVGEPEDVRNKHVFADEVKNMIQDKIITKWVATNKPADHVLVFDNQYIERDAYLVAIEIDDMIKDEQRFVQHSI